jgi:hypothetical protein
MQYAVLVLVGLLGLHAPEPASSARANGAIAAGKAKRASDAELRKRMIEESIAGYDGPCACPYQRARNGSACGKRSAYDRDGGYEPLCYPSDISDEMVSAYRTQRALDE